MAAAPADYGDAPDGVNAGYVTAPGVIGHFPSLAGSGGAHHTDVSGALRLGALFDVEADSKQVNRDRDDDGFFAQLQPCRPSTVTFVVNADGLPAALRSSGHTAYLNALFDWNRDGRWQGASSCGGRKVPEWLVQNHPVDMSRFSEQTIQAIQITVPAGPEVRELWMRATLTLDQKMTVAARGAFTRGETEDYFYSGAGPAPPWKGKKRKHAKHVHNHLLANCLPGFLPHGQAANFPVFFTDPYSGALASPPPGSVGISLANPAGAVPGDVGIQVFPYGYSVTSKLKDDRPNPVEWVLILVHLSAGPRAPALEPGPWSLGAPTSDGVTLACFVLILHAEPRPGPGGGPGGGQPGGGPGTPGSGGSSTNQPPMAAFSFTPNNPPTAPKAGDVLSFDGSGSSDSDGSVVGWSWSVGNPINGGGQVSISGATTPKPTMSFSLPGAYPVTLTVTDNGGKTAQVTQIVYVSGPGTKDGSWSTDPSDNLGCSNGITGAFVEIYIPTYAQIPNLNTAVAKGTPTGGCAGATVTITKITRTPSSAPNDANGPRLDAWGRVKDTVHIELTINGGTSAQGTVPFTVSWG